MVPAKVREREDFITNPSDARHGTFAGMVLAHCRCDRCERYRYEWWAEYYETKRKHPFYDHDNSIFISMSQYPEPNLSDKCTFNALRSEFQGKPDASNAWSQMSRCAICGEYGRLQHHHMVTRNGVEIINGRELRNPTIPLCGMGNYLGCHGKAHRHLIHFKPDFVVDTISQWPRWRGDYQVLILDKPCTEQEARQMDGWIKLNDIPRGIYG